MLRPEKVATPPDAATVVAPVSVPPPGLVPIDSVTALVALEIAVPPASVTVTWTEGAIAAPADTLDGWTVTMSLVAGPTALNAAVVAPARPLADTARVYPTPAALTVRSANVARPPSALTVS